MKIILKSLLIGLFIITVSGCKKAKSQNEHHMGPAPMNQQHPGPEGKPGMEAGRPGMDFRKDSMHGRGDFEDKLVEDLDLSEEQATKFKEIQEEYAGKSQEVMKAIAEEGRAKIKVIEEEKLEKLNEILTPEQLEKFTVLKDKMKGMRDKFKKGDQ